MKSARFHEIERPLARNCNPMFSIFLKHTKYVSYNIPDHSTLQHKFIPISWRKSDILFISLAKYDK